jgi:hypothetical protein
LKRKPKFHVIKKNDLDVCHVFCFDDVTITIQPAAWRAKAEKPAKRRASPKRTKKSKE